MENPIRLLVPDAGRTTLKADPEALELLVPPRAGQQLSGVRQRGIPGRVAVVSIIGCQRGGKSSVMNLLQRRSLQPGFGVGHSMDACTDGLWMWTRPHPRNPVPARWPDGRARAGADAAPAGHGRAGRAARAAELQLGALGDGAAPGPGEAHPAQALLVSQVFIYQTRGTIDQAAIERLDLILSIGAQVHGQASRLGRFLWLIRDQHLQLTKQLPKDEMLSKLSPPAVEALQRIFDEVDCAMLPKPLETTDLAGLEQCSLEQLSQQFQGEYVVLERRLFDWALDAGGSCGPELADMVSYYLEAIWDSQSGLVNEICKIPAQAELLGKIAADRAVKTAVELYQSKAEEMRSRLPCATADLQRWHQQAAEQAYEKIGKVVAHEASSR